MLVAQPSPWELHAHPDVWLLVGMVIGGYAISVRWWGPRRLGPAAAVVSRRQVAAFAAGVAAMWAGADWPVHDIAEGYLFSVHMVQHMLFSLIAPPLLLLGTPGWLLRALLGPPWVLGAWRVLTRPVVALVVFNTYVAISHWPDLVNLSLQSELVHFSLHAGLFVTALMMWWPVVSPLPEMPQLSPPAKMLYLFLQSVLPTVPASFLTFSQAPIYRFYESVPHPWVDALTDSRISGLIMKLGGGALLWGIIAVLFFRWYEREQREEAEVETWEDFERELEAWNLRR